MVNKKLKEIKADILVFGAGPAGISASINASKQGAKVILVERFPYIGGMSTLIPISMWPIVTALEIGELEQSYTGFPNEVIKRLKKVGGIEERSIVADGIDSWVSDDEKGNIKATSKWYFYDPQALKYIFFQMLEEAGVDLRVNSLAVKPILENETITGVEVESLTGRELLTGKIIIDATGSTDIVHRAGIPTDYGRSTDGAILPSSTSWRIAGVDTENLDTEKAISLYQEKRASGELDIPLEGLGLQVFCKGVVHIFGTRVFNVNPLDPVEAAFGEKEQRRQINDIFQMLKSEMPEFKDARIIDTGVVMGMIGTRRIQGEYHLTMDELLKANRFYDVIATGTFRMEVWDVKGSKNIFHHLKNDWYSFPYRCLLPKNLDNVIAAGSNISGQYEAMAAWAIQPVCMLTGQAAGTAAGICIADKVMPREISMTKLQDTLRENDVFLG